jgi:hypothetical protein
MKKQTTPDERCEFYRAHVRGRSYAQIAMQSGVSRACVRYWCRRQRDGGGTHSRYQRQPQGLLSRFDAKVRYGALRLRLKHPRWGPSRIQARLGKLPELRGLSLPSQASIGRYLHQWPRFRRPKVKRAQVRLRQPSAVHERWQMDFKLDIVLADGSQAILHTVRDPVGEACLGAQVFPTQPVISRQSRTQVDQVRTTLRLCFARWGMPDEIQTDGDPALVAQPGDSVPSHSRSGTEGLGIQHLVTRSGKPTDNAESSVAIAPSTTTPSSAARINAYPSCSPRWMKPSSNCSLNSRRGRKAVAGNRRLRPIQNCCIPGALFDPSSNWRSLTSSGSTLTWPPSPGDAKWVRPAKSRWAATTSTMP